VCLCVSHPTPILIMFSYFVPEPVAEPGHTLTGRKPLLPRHCSDVAVVWGTRPHGGGIRAGAAGRRHGQSGMLEERMEILVQDGEFMMVVLLSCGAHFVPSLHGLVKLVLGASW
jgi:hypothetical protein